MQYEAAMKWVKALRSGKYKQGRGLLVSYDKYCCLGVLCEINPDVVRRSHDTYIDVEGEEKAIYVLSENLLLKLEVKDKYFEVRIKGDASGNREVHKLSVLNDTLKYPFSRIADLIEEQWEDL